MESRRFWLNIAGGVIVSASLFGVHYTQTQALNKQVSARETIVATLKAEIEALKSQDFVLANQKLDQEIKDLQSLSERAYRVYQTIEEFRKRNISTDQHYELFIQIIKYLGEKNHDEAKNKLGQVEGLIKQQLDKDEQERIEQERLAREKIEAERKRLASLPKPSPLPTAPVNNSPDGSGYVTQQVDTGNGIFNVSFVAADLSSTKVLVDTASRGDCSNDCPVLPLSDYVSRTGAYAGINGSYFCPTAYPQCAGKTNTFDPILMNKDKTYFNWGNKIYNIYPLMMIYPGYVKIVPRAVDLSTQDTNAEAVFSNFPLLLLNNQPAFYGNSDVKMMGKGTRCFIANKGNIVYIGCMFNATTTEAARVLQAMGMTNAINLDNGGSTAFWYGGYKLGPGRNIPNAILFVKR